MHRFPCLGGVNVCTHTKSMLALQSTSVDRHSDLICLGAIGLAGGKRVLHCKGIGCIPAASVSRTLTNATSHG